MFLDLQFPFGRITFWPFTVTIEIGTGEITLQHWHVESGEVEQADVPPTLMPSDIFFNIESLDPILGAVFLTKSKETFLLLKLLVWFICGIASLTHSTRESLVPNVERFLLYGQG